MGLAIVAYNRPFFHAHQLWLVKAPVLAMLATLDPIKFLNVSRQKDKGTVKVLLPGLLLI